MSFTNTYETHVLNYVFTATSVTRPTVGMLVYLLLIQPTVGQLQMKYQETVTQELR